MRANGRIAPALAVLLLVLCACESGPRPTGEKGPAVITKLGLEGKWALDCASDFSRQNPHMIYTVPAVGSPTEQLLARDPRLDRVTPAQRYRRAGGRIRSVGAESCRRAGDGCHQGGRFAPENMECRHV
jgi:hypothetical protein